MKKIEHIKAAIAQAEQQAETMRLSYTVAMAQLDALKRELEIAEGS